jgi:hypothetical protein
MPYQPPNYADLDTPGTTRRRIHRIICENVLNGAKLAQFFESEVILGADDVERNADMHTRALSMRYTDPTEVIQLRNPETDAVVGSTSLGNILAAIYSLARHAQALDDAAKTEVIAQAEAAEAARLAAIAAAEAAAAAAAAEAAANPPQPEPDPPTTPE